MDSRAEEELLKNFHSFRTFGRAVKNFEYEGGKFFYGLQRRKTFVKLRPKCSSKVLDNCMVISFEKRWPTCLYAGWVVGWPQFPFSLLLLPTHSWNLFEMECTSILEHGGQSNHIYLLQGYIRIRWHIVIQSSLDRTEPGNTFAHTNFCKVQVLG